ncbi:Hydroxysteroid dehydrogenase-like protein 2, partial [Larimichthys crocea]
MHTHYQVVLHVLSDWWTGHPLLPDYFLDSALEKMPELHETTKPPTDTPTSSGPIGSTFDAIKGAINEDVVKSTQGIYQFNLSGEHEGVWFLDLKSGSGSTGQGQPPVKADVVMTMDSTVFSKMFAGAARTDYQKACSSPATPTEPSSNWSAAEGSICRLLKNSCFCCKSTKEEVNFPSEILMIIIFVVYLIPCAHLHIKNLSPGRIHGSLSHQPWSSAIGSSGSPAHHRQHLVLFEGCRDNAGGRSLVVPLLPIRQPFDLAGSEGFDWSDLEADWLTAKTFVRSADFADHELRSHFLHTHVMSELFAMATLRNFPMVHPLYKLLVPHFRFTLEIDALARQLLLSDGGSLKE